MGVALFLATETASCQVSMESAPRFVSLGAVRVLRQCREGRCVLSRYPSRGDFLREPLVRRLLVFEDLFDGALGHLGRDAFCAQFGREACFAAWAVAQAVTHKGRRNRFVVEKSALL